MQISINETSSIPSLSCMTKEEFMTYVSDLTTNSAEQFPNAIVHVINEAYLESNDLIIKVLSIDSDSDFMEDVTECESVTLKAKGLLINGQDDKVIYSTAEDISTWLDRFTDISNSSESEMSIDISGFERIIIDGKDLKSLPSSITILFKYSKDEKLSVTMYKWGSSPITLLDDTEIIIK